MRTTIQLEKPTVERIKQYKRFPKESYDQIINTILNEVEDETLTPEEIEDLQEALEQVKKGELFKIEDVAKELGISL